MVFIYVTQKKLNIAWDAYILFFHISISIVSLPVCEHILLHEPLSRIIGNTETMSWEIALDLATPAPSLISPTQMKCHK